MTLMQKKHSFSFGHGNFSIDNSIMSVNYLFAPVPAIQFDNLGNVKTTYLVVEATQRR